MRFTFYRVESVQEVANLPQFGAALRNSFKSGNSFALQLAQCVAAVRRRRTGATEIQLYDR